MNQQIINIVNNALSEDAARNDITTRILIPDDLKIDAEIISREKGIACGISVAELAFKLLDKNIRFKAMVKDGAIIKKGDVLVKIYGKARSILSAERTALNLLAHLSGIATLTNEFAKKVKPYRTKILDTRKTTPNLRLLEKYAVRCGGGFNYRFNLSDAILIKDNHIQATSRKPQATSLKEIIRKVKEKAKGKKIEIEVENLSQFKEALAASPDIIMLDNFKILDIEKAVKLRKSFFVPRSSCLVKLEASGGVSIRNVKKIASTGVDFISIGALTHSVKSLDLSLEIL
ncbi:MAG: carboxylating nicotinate-nucleotide diphosphorylase [Candidatus Omnitrophota bacterium]